MNIRALLSLFIIMVFFLSGCNQEDKKQQTDVELSSYVMDTTKALELLKDANSYTSNIPDSVSYYANEAIKLSENINYNRGIALGNYYLGVAEWAKGNYPESITYHKKTLKLTKSNQIRALALRDISLSLIYLDRNAEARIYLDESIEIFKSLDDKYALTLAYVNCGLIEGKNQNYLLALGHYQEALKLSEETGSLTNKSLILNNLGVINSKLEMNTLALENYQQAYDIIKEHDDPKLKALYLNNIANIQIELKNYDEALRLVDTGLLITEESGDKRSKVFLLSNKGKTLLKQKNYPLAIIYYNKALLLAKETGVIDNTLKILIGLGTIHYELNNFNKSMTYLNEALETALEKDEKEIIKETSEMKAKIHSSRANFKEAFLCLEMSNKMADSLSKSKIVKQFTQMEMQYKFDEEVYKNKLVQQKINLENKQKLERQRFLLYVFIAGFAIILFFVILLFRNYRIIQKLNLRLEDSYNKTKEQNRLIEKKNNDLESLNNTKNKLFSLIAHDLTSPFDTILGFTEMFSAQYDELDELKRKHYLKQIHLSSKYAFNLLKNLLIWARSQKGDIEIKPETVILSEFVNKSINPFLSGAKEKGIIVQLNLPDDKIKLDKFTMQSTLANLFNNAVKFTQKGGEITIWTEKKSSKIELSISDNGVGIPPDRIKTLFKIGKNQSTLGTNNEKGTGLGLIICNDFARKNRGKLIVKSESGQGSTFTVILPHK